MSVADGTSVIPPGWYPDPADDARLRRWDGQQWTQEVLLAPEQEPAAPAASSSAPPPPPQATAQPSTAQPSTSQPSASQPSTAQPSATQPAASQPPPGQPVPASPAPSTAPPGVPTSTAPPGVPTSTAPPGVPTSTAPPQGTPQPPLEPTIPRPSPTVNHHANPSSGPVSLPEWATLPGLTLPPDLSSLPGMHTDSVLHAPTFAEPENREPPTKPAFEPPFIPQRPDVQELGRQRPEPTKAEPVVPPPPATPYAPPPSGAQYDVPPPPGMAHVPSAGPVLPPSAFVAPQVPATAWPQLPPVSSAPSPVAPAAPVGFVSLTKGPFASGVEPSVRLVTVSSWLIAALPLLQFAVVYLVFGTLKVTLAPGMQWGVLAAPAAFSLLFANADKKKLTSLGAASPNVIFGLIAPLYLLVRCVTTGRSSILPLVAWVVLQAAAVAGVYYLLPAVLATAIRAMGFH